MPSTDFEALASVMCSVRDEVSALRHELYEVRKEREKDIKILEQSDNLVQEIGDIKSIILSSRTDAVPPSPHYDWFNCTSDKSNTVSGGVEPKGKPLPMPGNSSSALTAPVQQPSYASMVNLPVRNMRAVGKATGQNMSTLTSTSSTKSTIPKNTNSKTRNSVIKKGNRILNENENFKFSCSDPMISVYVGGCSTETTTDGIVSFCEKQNVKVEYIEELNSRNKFNRSFKLTVQNGDRDSVLNENFWPLGVIFRRFYYHRNAKQSSL